MSKEEKILALQLILEDIRGNWGWELEDRVSAALDLAQDLSSTDIAFKDMVDSIKTYMIYCEDGHDDGRYFRGSFPYGYEGMDELHKLKNTYKDKSNEFKIVVECLTYPEYRFTDWQQI